jgi:formylglycine-generating enzyme required for sulfatase activity
MADCLRGWFRRFAGVLIPFLFGVGCVLITPTPPTESAPLPGPPPAPVAAFSTREITGRVIRADNSEEILEKGRELSVQVADRIQLDKTGQGLLKFQDRLEVGMFRETELDLADANEESSGSTFVSLNLNRGNMRLRLIEGNIVWVILKTEYVIMTTLEQGTDFVVCHSPGIITCGIVNEGAVEFQAQGEKKIAKKGEAIYVRPDEPPSDAICAHEQEVVDWLNDIQGSGEVLGLGKIVQNWRQEPCSSTPSPQTTTAPSSREGMGKVEAGLYEIGRAQADNFHIVTQEITLEPFWIDIYEVTNAEYQAYLSETGRQPLTIGPGQENHPVKEVTWEDAASFCASVNKRLPTEAEWEVAARGPGPLPPLYPWGEDPAAGGQVTALPLNDTYPVGAYPFNQSPFGIYDMAGNVWEWVGEPYAPVPEGHLILRGGRHGLIRDSAYRQEVAPEQELFISYAGIRCAADGVEGE